MKSLFSVPRCLCGSLLGLPPEVQRRAQTWDTGRTLLRTGMSARRADTNVGARSGEKNIAAKNARTRNSPPTAHCPLTHRRTDARARSTPVPRSYRDPLVLFYRSGDSTAEVAEALELSEEAVRQRLSRGRAMLNERVARLVESGLRRSNPTKMFTVGVLAALPLVSAQASLASATTTATAKGTGALKTASGLGAFVTALTGILPALGGFIGLWGHLENTRTARERRFIAWSCLGLVGWMIVLGVAAGLVSGGGSAFGLRVNRADLELSNAIRLSLFWLAFAGPLDAYAVWMALRQKRIRAEDAQSAQRPIEASRRGYWLSMYGSMLAMVFGTTGWLFLAAQRAQDWTTLGVLTLLCVAGWLGCAGLAVKRPTTPARVKQVFVGLCTRRAHERGRWPAGVVRGEASRQDVYLHSFLGRRSARRQDRFPEDRGLHDRTGS